MYMKRVSLSAISCFVRASLMLPRRTITEFEMGGGAYTAVLFVEKGTCMSMCEVSLCAKTVSRGRPPQKTASKLKVLQRCD